MEEIKITKEKYENLGEDESTLTISCEGVYLKDDLEVKFEFSLRPGVLTFKVKNHNRADSRITAEKVMYKFGHKLPHDLFSN